MGLFYDIVHTKSFEYGLSIACQTYFVIFPLIRFIVNEYETAPTFIYMLMYMYLACSTLGLVIYGVENLWMDQTIERHRQPNGEVRCNPIIFFYSILFFIGHFNIPLIRVIRNPNDPCHRTLSCQIFLALPVLSAFCCILIFTPLYDYHLDWFFWITWLLYIYLYLYMMVYGFLAITNFKYHLIYFNPLTYPLYLSFLPFLNLLKPKDKMVEIQLNDSVSTDPDIEKLDIEGFAEVLRPKVHRHTVGVRPVKTKTKEILPDDIPSVEDDISRVSEESKLELCPVCKEALDKSQHQVGSACGHEFHFKCLMSEMKTSRICPICGEKLRPK